MNQTKSSKKVFIQIIQMIFIKIILKYISIRTSYLTIRLCQRNPQYNQYLKSSFIILYNKIQTQIIVVTNNSNSK